MDSNEILKFSIQNGLLLDKEILNLLSETVDADSAKLIIEKIKHQTSQRVITKDIFNREKEKLTKVLSTLPQANQESVEKLKIKLGLTIEVEKEISHKIPIQKEFKNNVKILQTTHNSNEKIIVGDFVKHFRTRFEFLRNILQERAVLKNLISINKISNNSKQNLSIIGIVFSRRVTKNGNLILELEDLTGRVNVLISSNKKDLFDLAENLVEDCIIGVNCSGDRKFLFANEIVLPESKISERKRSIVDESVAFIGDIHFGDKLFFKDSFLKFINYLNGDSQNSEEAKKIKYLFLAGDIVSGVGNYPKQENDLEIKDLEDQFFQFAELLKKIRKDITIIIFPGNHDGVRLMEPQPGLDEKFAWPLYDMENVIITENPSWTNIGSHEGFGGFNVLGYHGTSFFYYSNNVPDLIKKKAANSPEEIMKYLLKHRHLAPNHTSAQTYPLEEDGLLLKQIPDIFVAAHTHKCEITYSNNILLVSVACWEDMTSYQEKFGNKPDHCKVPVFNLKTGKIKILDFEEKGGKDESN